MPSSFCTCISFYFLLLSFIKHCIVEKWKEWTVIFLIIVVVWAFLHLVLCWLEVYNSLYLSFWGVLPVSLVSMTFTMGFCQRSFLHLSKYACDKSDLIYMMNFIYLFTYVESSVNDYKQSQLGMMNDLFEWHLKIIYR